jgi:hypothetical protein
MSAWRYSTACCLICAGDREDAWYPASKKPIEYIPAILLYNTAMGKLSIIKALAQNGLFYLTEHADDEAQSDNFDIYDVENGILTGKVRKNWPKEGKIEIIGHALDGRLIGVVCRLTPGNKVRVITVYEDKP